MQIERWSILPCIVLGRFEKYWWYYWRRIQRELLRHVVATFHPPPLPVSSDTPGSWETLQMLHWHSALQHQHHRRHHLHHHCCNCACNKQTNMDLIWKRKMVSTPLSVFSENFKKEKTYYHQVKNGSDMNNRTFETHTSKHLTVLP